MGRKGSKRVGRGVKGWELGSKRIDRGVKG